jgi:hypothetical protein
MAAASSVDEGPGDEKMASQRSSNSKGITSVCDAAPASVPALAPAGASTAGNDLEKGDGSAAAAAALRSSGAASSDGNDSAIVSGGGGSNNGFGERPACFSSTFQEVSFVFQATVATATSSFLTGVGMIITANIGRDLGMTQGEISWITASTSYVGIFLTPLHLLLLPVFLFYSSLLVFGRDIQLQFSSLFGMYFTTPKLLHIDNGTVSLEKFSCSASCQWSPPWL